MLKVTRRFPFVPLVCFCIAASCINIALFGKPFKGIKTANFVPNNSVTIKVLILQEWIHTDTISGPETAALKKHAASIVLER
jgi:hypothetical protein